MSKARRYLTKAEQCEQRASKVRCPETREWQMILARAYRMLAEAESGDDGAELAEAERALLGPKLLTFTLSSAVDHAERRSNERGTSMVPSLRPKRMIARAFG
jgi:hypothetical protein